jgi:RNA ligase
VSEHLPTLNISELFDKDLLVEMLEKGYIKKEIHPTEQLYIYNYTPRAQYERVWNEVTLQCRGLVTDASGIILARPFKKFFNHFELDTSLLSTAPVTVTEKLDGSLGILYPSSSGYAIATRGSFTSDQAQHATDLWRTKYSSFFTPEPSYTYLFEIIYPGNRIVVDYGEVDDLFLLGAVHTQTGGDIPLSKLSRNWPGPVAQEHGYKNLTEALSAPIRENAEGYVLFFESDGSRIKLKHDTYVEIHRVVTEVSERRIWEALQENSNIDAWLELLPDELYHSVILSRDRLLSEYKVIHQNLQDKYAALISKLGDPFDRKSFAAAVKSLPRDPLNRVLFLIHDKAPFDHLIWSHIKPRDHSPFFNMRKEEQ